MPDVQENDLLLIGGKHVKQPTQLDDGGCFEPFKLQVSVSLALEPEPKRNPSRLKSNIDRILLELGIPPSPIDTAPETEFPAPAAAKSAGNIEMTQASEILIVPVEAPLPPPREATAVELLTWIKRGVLALTHLKEDDAEIVAIWTVSTWFQDALAVVPCLTITGPAHESGVVLHCLEYFCRWPILLSGFRRSHLGVLRGGYFTNLVSEPNLDKRTASLLSDLTDRNFRVVDGGSLRCCSRSAAVYAGENPGTHKIQNSIHIHVSPTTASPTLRPEWLEQMIERVPVHLKQYREKNLKSVKSLTWFPSGLYSDTAATATALGRCIVDAPELRRKLVFLLKTKNQQQLAEISNTSEVIILEATLALSRDGRTQAFVREIAAEANRLLEAHDELLRLSPEKVGHRLKTLGLRTRPLSQKGNGLTFDNATIAQIEQLAAVYMMEDGPPETENLHSTQATEKKKVEEVMEVVEAF